MRSDVASDFDRFWETLSFARRAWGTLFFPSPAGAILGVPTVTGRDFLRWPRPGSRRLRRVWWHLLNAGSLRTLATGDRFGTLSGSIRCPERTSILP
jgi:hypothetical protein